MKKTAIEIEVKGVTLAGELYDGPCARRIAAALPIEGAANTWGDEIYFDIGIAAELDDSAHMVVELGDIGYWPTGQAICLFFGPTPVSEPGEIRPASAVNVVGKILGDLEILKQVADGATVSIRAAEEAER